MYDCQSDRYTEFSLSDSQTTSAHSLLGELTAHAIHDQNPYAAFDALEALARRHGYQVERGEASLKVIGVHLADALNFNACFGEQLVINCDLRRAQPVRFNV